MLHHPNLPSAEPVRAITVRTPRNRIRPRFRRGVVMMEMVLVLPLIFFLLVGLFFFGRGVVRVQHAHVMDRYEVWREVAAARNARDEPLSPHRTSGSLLNAELNRAFFGGRASLVEVRGQGFRLSSPRRQLTDTASYWSTDAADLLANVTGAWPSDRRVTVQVQYPVGDGRMSRLQGPIVHRHWRVGNEWRLVNGWRQDNDGIWHPSGGGVGISSRITEQFYETFDQTMADFEAAPNRHAGSVRRLYRSRPGYSGPDIRW